MLRPPLKQGKVESARIRTENIIRSDITTELHEIIELYCELLIARSQLLEPPGSNPSLSAQITPGDKNAAHHCDPGLEEAVRSLIYAAPRTDVKELHQARALLVERFGKDFALSAMEGNGVAERVLSKLKIEAPRQELVDAYLKEIGRTYGISWPGEDREDGEEDGQAGDDDDEDNPSGKEPPVALNKSLEGPLSTEELSRATPPRDLGPASPPVKIAPQSPSTENPAPKLRLPGPPDLKPNAKMAKAVTENNKAKKDGAVGGKIPEIDDLAKRFAALKR